MTRSDASKALQASECSEMLDPKEANCRISAEHWPDKFTRVTMRRGARTRGKHEPPREHSTRVRTNFADEFRNERGEWVGPVLRCLNTTIPIARMNIHKKLPRARAHGSSKSRPFKQRRTLSPNVLRRQCDCRWQVACNVTPAFIRRCSRTAETYAAAPHANGRRMRDTVK
jgi:hypothetical protein